MGVSEMRRTSGMGNWNRLSVIAHTAAAMAVGAMAASGGSLAFSNNSFRKQETQPC